MPAQTTGAALRKEVSALKAAVARIEALLGAEATPGHDPYARRRRILQMIYERGGMDRATLEPILHDHGTDIRWVGQQVKRGFLQLLPKQGGSFYAVTQTAVQELSLDRREDIDEWTRASAEAFAEDWDSDADAAYDTL